MSWLRSWRDEPLTTRLAVPADRAALTALLADTWRRYGDAAHEDQAALLANGSSAIAFMRNEPVGFLGLAARAPTGAPAELWVDVDLTAVHPDRVVGRTLQALLAEVTPVLRGQRATGLVCLTTAGWLQEGLLQAGFADADQVITYLHPLGRHLPEGEPVARLRPAAAGTWAAVLALNAAAFEPFWRYDDATLTTWLLTSDRAVVAEWRGKPAGFALTANGAASTYAHLIRVATHPAARGIGIGRQLVVDALRYAHEYGAAGLALNTQASNAVSRSLYESLGFRRTGQELSVLTLRL